MFAEDHRATKHFSAKQNKMKTKRTQRYAGPNLQGELMLTSYVFMVSVIQNVMLFFKSNSRCHSQMLLLLLVKVSQFCVSSRFYGLKCQIY